MIKSTVGIPATHSWHLSFNMEHKLQEPKQTTESNVLILNGLYADHDFNLETRKLACLFCFWHFFCSIFYYERSVSTIADLRAVICTKIKSWSLCCCALLLNAFIHHDHPKALENCLNPTSWSPFFLEKAVLLNAVA